MVMSMGSRQAGSAMPGRRRVVTSGGGFTGLVDKVLYAVTAVLVVCTVSLAGQGMFFERVRTVDDEGAQSPSPATSKPRAPRAASSGQGCEGGGVSETNGVGQLPRNPSTARDEPRPAGTGT